MSVELPSLNELSTGLAHPPRGQIRIMGLLSLSGLGLYFILGITLMLGSRSKPHVSFSLLRFLNGLAGAFVLCTLYCFFLGNAGSVLYTFSAVQKLVGVFVLAFAIHTAAMAFRHPLGVLLVPFILLVAPFRWAIFWDTHIHRGSFTADHVLRWGWIAFAACLIAFFTGWLDLTRRARKQRKDVTASG